MTRRSTEALLAALLQETGGPDPPGYLMLRGEPAPIVLVFEDGVEAPLFVFKAARDTASREALETEHRVLAALRAFASADFRETLPRPIAGGELNGVLANLLSILPGARLKDLPPKRVFGPATVDSTLGKITDWLHDYHAVTQAVCGDELPVSRDKLIESPAESYLRWFRVEPEERELITRSVAGLPDPGSPGLPLWRSHGDFSPANVLWDSGRIGVIDFEYALEPCLPLEDLFHFLASLRSTTSGEDRERQRRGYFQEVFYSSGRLGRAAHKAVHDLARRTGVGLDLIEHLFVMTWVRFAVRGVELQIRHLDLDALRDDPDRLWKRLDAEPDEFLPVSRIGGGICVNLRQHAEMRDRFVLP